MKTLPAILLCVGAALASSCSKKTDVAPAVPVATNTLDSAARAAVADDAADEADKLTPNVDLSSVYRYTVTDITGHRVNLGAYRGKKILIVNTASQCGYTPQYTDLERLYTTYGNRVVVLGFPCNDFGGQEPGTDGQINQFCTGTYNVTFPMFSRVPVIGTAATPLYKFLGDQTRNGFTSARPDWNFCKYLIDERGHVINFYRSAVTPMSPALLADILAPPTFLNATAAAPRK